jgi:excisionase family DNA binding protein
VSKNGNSYTFELPNVHIVRFYQLTTGIVVCFRKIYVVKDNPEPVKAYGREGLLSFKMGRTKLYRMAQEGNIPASKVGNQWRFDREEIDEWMKRQRPFDFKSHGA